MPGALLAFKDFIADHISFCCPIYHLQYIPDSVYELKMSDNCTDL